MAGRQNPNQFTFGVKNNSIQSTMFGPNAASTEADAPSSDATSEEHVSAAAFKKANEEHAAASAEYHEKLAEYEKKNDELQAKLDQAIKYTKLQRKQHDELKVENTENEKRATTAEAQAKTLSSDVKAFKDENQRLRDQVDTDTKMIKKYRDEAEREKRDSKQAKKNANEQVQHAQIAATTLTQENEQLQAQVNEATTQLQNAHHELQAIFDESPDLNLTDLIDCARVAKQNPTLNQKPSESSLSEDSIKSTEQRPVSLQQQLDDAGYDSADDEKEEEDDTIQGPIYSNYTKRMMEKYRARSAKEKAAKEAAQAPKPSRTSSFDSLFDDPNDYDSAPPLHFSPIVSVSIAPVAPEPVKPELQDHVVAQPEIRERHIAVLPGWFTPLILLLVLLTISVFTNLVTERRMWAAANNLARKRIVDISLSGASVWNPLLGFFADIDELIGVGHGILG